MAWCERPVGGHLCFEAARSTVGNELAKVSDMSKESEDDRGGRKGTLSWKIGDKKGRESKLPLTLSSKEYSACEPLGTQKSIAITTESDHLIHWWQPHSRHLH